MKILAGILVLVLLGWLAVRLVIAMILWEDLSDD